MNEITSDRDKEIRSKYQCGYYTLPQVQLAYGLSRGEAITILCREPSVMDQQRKELEILDFIREIEATEKPKEMSKEEINAWTDGPWKCVCGNVNDGSFGCSCGLTVIGSNIERLKREREGQKEKKD